MAVTVRNPTNSNSIIKISQEGVELQKPNVVHMKAQKKYNFLARFLVLQFLPYLLKKNFLAWVGGGVRKRISNETMNIFLHDHQFGQFRSFQR